MLQHFSLYNSYTIFGGEIFGLKPKQFNHEESNIWVLEEISGHESSI